MGLVLGIIAVLLVLFLIFVMALAEWADTDLGSLFQSLLGRGKKKPDLEDAAPRAGEPDEATGVKKEKPAARTRVRSAVRTAQKTGATRSSAKDKPLGRKKTVSAGPAKKTKSQKRKTT